MGIDRHDYVKKLNIYDNNYTRYIIDAIYNLFAQYFKYIIGLFEHCYEYYHMEIINSQKNSVYNTLYCKYNILLTDTCIILSNGKNPIRIPYENISRFEMKAGYIIILHVLGKYNFNTNNIYLDEDICHIILHCKQAVQLFNKMKHYMYYHIQFNKFNLDIIDIYNNKNSITNIVF